MPCELVSQEDEKGLMHSKISAIVLPLVLVALLSLLITGCGISLSGTEQATDVFRIRETELELFVQQTLIAQQQTAKVPNNTIQDLQSTMDAQAAQATQLAGQMMTLQPVDISGSPTVPPAEQSVVATELPLTSAPVDSAEFKEWKKSANILLYEDMAARLDTKTFIKDTLTRMGLPFKFDGNAKGWLQTDLDNGAPEEKPWDLVIIATEDKTTPENKVFDYALSALERGSSVILENWYIDRTYRSSAMRLLEKCGVEYDGNLFKIPPNRRVMFPMDTTHPILNSPNVGLNFSKTSNYWWDSSGKVSYDMGDLVRLAPNSSAKPVLGTVASNPSGHATLVTCIDGRLTLLTFSSHILMYEVMQPLWENMIDNALQTRYQTMK